MSDPLTSKNRPTPGPWKLDTEDPEIVRAGDPDHYVAICNPTVSNPADGQLIAATPDLVAALKRSLNWLTSYPGGGADGAYIAAVDALKKAGCYD